MCRSGSCADFARLLGGDGRIRTADKGFADPRLNHLATSPLERETGFEPATFSLARRRATTAPLPRITAGDSRPRRFNYTPWGERVSTLIAEPGLLVAHTAAHAVARSRSQVP